MDFIRFSFILGVVFGTAFAFPGLFDNKACPEDDGKPGICAFTCGSCKEDQICCRTNCGGNFCYTPPSTTLSTTSNTPSSTPLPSYKPPRKCPKEKEVRCFLNPCSVNFCWNYPWAECRADYCGGCNARFYDNGKEVTQKCGGFYWK